MKVFLKEYLDPIYLHGLIQRNKERLSSVLRARILAIGVDMCKWTTCDNGCRTENRVDNVNLKICKNKFLKFKGRSCYTC